MHCQSALVSPRRPVRSTARFETNERGRKRTGKIFYSRHVHGAGHRALQVEWRQSVRRTTAQAREARIRMRSARVVRNWRALVDAARRLRRDVSVRSREGQDATDPSGRPATATPPIGRLFCPRPVYWHRVGQRLRWGRGYLAGGFVHGARCGRRLVWKARPATSLSWWSGGDHASFLDGAEVYGGTRGS
jgi:hypothetical protein